jgi:O-antigen/teichoic acid export membrane protein
MTAISAGNTRRQLAVVITAWVSRILAAAAQLLLIRVFLTAMGADQYAVFVVIFSLMNWYLLVDFGVGSAVQNFVSERIARGESPNALILAACKLALGAFAVVILVLLVGTQFLALSILGKFSFISLAERSQLIFWSGAMFAANGVGGIAYKIWYAMGRGYLANIIPALALLLGSFLGGYAVQHAGAHALEYGTLLFALPSGLAGLGSLLAVSLKAAAGPDRGAPPPTAILDRAMRFWILYVMQNAVVNIDVIVLAQFLPPQQIVTYSVASRMFAFSSFFYTSIYTTLWPAFAENIVCKNWRAVRHRLVEATLFSFVWMLLFSIAMFFWSNDLAELIAPSAKLVFPSDFILLLILYNLVVTLVYGFGIILLSMSALQTLLICTLAQAVINIALQLFLVPRIGIAGTPLSLLISFSLTMGWALPLKTLRRLR